MKKRLLFWVNGFMLHFGLAYYLQEKLDADFYAIIDIPNNPKKMFLNQKMIDFKKTWYFHDNIKKTTSNHDLEYLSDFEKKYQLNLWKLAINERHFYRFNRFYKFSTDEILTILEQECRLFEQILDESKPDFVLTYDPPFHHQKLFLDICKARKIKILCMYIARMGGKSIIAGDGVTLDLPQNLDLVKLNDEKNKIDKINLTKINYNSNYSDLTKNYKIERSPSILNKLKALTDYILLSDSNNAQTNFTYYGRSKYKVILDNILLIMKTKNRSNFMKNNLVKKVDLNNTFVYFPMNIEEESSMLNYSPFYTNQIEVIRHIAKSIPIEYKLYVKEHIFAEFRGWHSIHEYQEIMDIPNVTLIHPSYSSKELIKNSKLVITIRGTASLDAAFVNIPSIVFGDVSYDILSSIYKVSSINELPNLIKTALKTKVDPLEVQKYTKLIEDNSVDFDMMDFEIKRNQQFYSGNTLSDINIKESDVKQFFENNKEYFEKLVDAHLIKINISKF